LKGVEDVKENELDDPVCDRRPHHDNGCLRANADSSATANPASGGSADNTAPTNPASGASADDAA
jgi:hypothetical protein